MIEIFALTLSLLTGIDDELGDDLDFTFYLSEFATSELPKGDPMQQIIVDHLVESVFNTTREDTFQQHIRLLKSTAKSNPDKADRFSTLDSRLKVEFDKKMKEAKQKRLIYTAGGAVAGAVLGIPVGKMLSNATSMGSKILYLTVPAGALAGAGAGYLLGDLIAVPNYSYEPGTMTRDLELVQQEIEEDL